MFQLRNGVNTWDHKVFLSSPMNKLHIQDGFIPILHWSAESSKEHSHLSRVEYLQWLPNSVWVSLNVKDLFRPILCKELFY